MASALTGKTLQLNRILAGITLPRNKNKLVICNHNSLGDGVEAGESGCVCDSLLIAAARPGPSGEVKIDAAHLLEWGYKRQRWTVRAASTSSSPSSSPLLLTAHSSSGFLHHDVHVYMVS